MWVIRMFSEASNTVLLWTLKSHEVIVGSTIGKVPFVPVDEVRAQAT
jgi:hypothetical protein